MMKYLSSFFLSFPRYFFLLFAVFFMVSFFAFYESFRVYRAEAELVVLPRGSSVSTEAITATLAHIPSTLAFYDRLREDHTNISDPWEGESATDRKRAWERVIDSLSVPKSGLIRLSVSSDDALQANALLNASIETLYGFSGRLYNRDTQADLRLVEDALVYPTVTHEGLLLLMSVVCAALGALLVSSLLQQTTPFLKRVSFPNIASFRKEKLFLDTTTANASAIRPVGSFPDIINEPTLTPEVSALPKKPIFSGESFPIKHDQEKTLSSVSVPEEARVETMPEEKKEEPATASLQKAYPVAKHHDEPQDIWDKSRFVAEQPKAEEQATSDISPMHTPYDIAQGESLEMLSKHTEASQDISSTISMSKIPELVDQPTTLLARGGRHAGVPGNLSTVLAKDFTWEKFLFQGNDAQKETLNEDEEKSEEKEVTSALIPEVASAGHTPGKREPTPEELKARLNQLLRGEL